MSTSGDGDDDDEAQDMGALLAAILGASFQRRNDAPPPASRSTAGPFGGGGGGGGMPAGLRAMLQGGSPGLGGLAGLGGPGGGEPRLLILSTPGGGLIGAMMELGGPLAMPMALAPSMGGGQDGGGQADSGHGMLERALLATMEQMMMRAAEERSNEEQRSPPANEMVRDSLPRVVVTKEDQLDATNSKCSICLEEYSAGSRATRMFCGHLFCTACIREWLRNANSCPVCRFELQTDNARYEEGRKDRMRGRKARLKGGDLSMMRTPDLKKLMRSLGVPSDNCIEKSDLISQLSSSPNVELSVDRSDILYEEGELNALELPMLRSLMERHRIVVPPSGDVVESAERSEALMRFAEAGWLGSERQKAVQAKRFLESKAAVSSVTTPTTASSTPSAFQMDGLVARGRADGFAVRPNSRGGELPRIASPASSAASGSGHKRPRSSLSLAGSVMASGTATASSPAGAGGGLSMAVDSSPSAVSSTTAVMNQLRQEAGTALRRPSNTSGSRAAQAVQAARGSSAAANTADLVERAGRTSSPGSTAPSPKRAARSPSSMSSAAQPANTAGQTETRTASHESGGGTPVRPVRPQQGPPAVSRPRVGRRSTGGDDRDD